MAHNQDDSHGGAAAGGWCRNSKKPKLPKAPPQRGPGVAELEKILREQGQGIDEAENKAFTHCAILSLANRRKPPQAPSPPPMTMTINNSGKSNSGGEGSKSSSGLQIPLYFPETWSSPPLLSNRHCEYPPWMMNLFMPSTSSTLSSSASGMNQNRQVEFPSNQRSASHSSFQQLPEEKPVDLKRQWPFIDDLQFHIFPNKVLRQMQKSDLPSSYDYWGRMGFKTSKPTFRDIKTQAQNGDTDCRTKDANFLTLGLPATSLQNTTETFNEKLSGIHLLHCQERTDDPGLQSNRMGPCNGKSFYNFLPLFGQEGWPDTSLSSPGGREETTGDVVDLNLKL